MQTQVDLWWSKGLQGAVNLLEQMVQANMPVEVENIQGLIIRLEKAIKEGQKSVNDSRPDIMVYLVLEALVVAIEKRVESNGLAQKEIVSLTLDLNKLKKVLYVDV